MANRYGDQCIYITLAHQLFMESKFDTSTMYPLVKHLKS